MSPALSAAHCPVQRAPTLVGSSGQLPFLMAADALVHRDKGSMELSAGWAALRASAPGLQSACEAFRLSEAKSFAAALILAGGERCPQLLPVWDVHAASDYMI